MCGLKVYLHIFLTSTLDGSELSGPPFGRFSPGKRAPGTPWIGRRLGGPRTSLEVGRKGQIPASAGNRTPVFQPITRKYNR